MSLTQELATGTTVDLDGDASTPVGAPFAEDTGGEGVRVVACQGECFGTRIEWFEQTEATAYVANDGETGQPMLIIQYREDGGHHKYRGHERATNTWWRHAHEADPREYREHCVRILRRV